MFSCGYRQILVFIHDAFLLSILCALARHCESDLSFHVHDPEEIPVWRPQLQFSTPLQRLQATREHSQSYVKFAFSVHCSSWAKQTFYQTDILVSAQHRWCHKVAAGDPWEPDQFVRLVWLQQEEVSLGIIKSVFISWLSVGFKSDFFFLFSIYLFIYRIIY